MEFHATFSVDYTPGEGKSVLKVKQHGRPEITFHHYSTDAQGELVRSTRVLFRNGDYTLPVPMIYAASPQAAIGVAVKVAADRGFALGHVGA